MTGKGITLFVERLTDWARSAPGARLPALEAIVADGLALPPPAGTAAFPDAIRFALLGGPSSLPVPAGALAAAAKAGSAVRGHWLRAEPVTLLAGPAQVYLAGAGFLDYSPQECEELALAVRAELASAGMDAGTLDAEPWVLRLPGPLGFEFEPLAKALGADVAPLLPDAPVARPWRRLMNDLQVVLHNLPVNERRRRAGRAFVNGIWFWGAGELPLLPPPAPFTSIFANRPVSAGMCRWYGLEPASVPLTARASLKSGGAVFIDWWDDDADAASALARLEAFVAETLREPLPARGPLRLYSGTGQGWQARKGRPWFRRRRFEPLAAALRTAAGKE